MIVQLSCPKCGGSLAPDKGDIDENADCKCGAGKQLVRYLQIVLNSMKRFKRLFVPLPDGFSPYLERFHLEQLPDGSRTYLHIIYESDGDRDPHDHPFDFESTIVWGIYEEHNYYFSCPIDRCPDGERYDEDGECCNGHKLMMHEARPTTYVEGDQNIKRAAQLHRLTIVKGPVVTLVQRGPKLREWGFQTEDGWVHHKDYIKAKWPNHDAGTTELDD